MPNYEFRLQVKFKCDSKSKPDVGGAPSGGSEPSKMDVMFFVFVYLRFKMPIPIHFKCFSKKNGPGTSPRDAPYPGYIESCASTCFVYDMQIMF